MNSLISDLYSLFIHGSNTVSDLVNSLHPKKLTNLVNIKRNRSIFEYEPIRVFHSFLFDPAWLCHDQEVERFNNQSVCNFDEFINFKFINEVDFKPQNFFPGAFTYHLHLSDFSRNTLLGFNLFKNVYLIRNESYFEYFENYYSLILELDE